MIPKTFSLFVKIALPIYLLNMIICLPLVILSFRLPQETHFAAVIIYNCFTMILFQIISIKAASSLYKEETLSWKNILRSSISKYQLLFLYSLLYFVVSSLALICFIVPGIILSLMAFFVVPLIILENLSIQEAWKCSREITKGLRLRILGYYALIMIFIFVFFSLLGSLSLLEEMVINRQPLFVKTLFRVIGYPLDCFSTVWISTFITVAYYTRRKTYVPAQPAAT